MDRTSLIIASAAVLLLISTPAKAKYSGGTGDPNDPYRIATPNDLNDIGNHPNDFDKHFKLTADIDLSGFAPDAFNVIATSLDDPFVGVFDGNGHRISNFTYTTNAGTYNIAIFGFVDDPNALITDLVITDPNIWAPAAYYVAPLVARLVNGTIIRCHTYGGTVRASHYVGGLVGNSNATLSYSSSTASVAGSSHVGGLAGCNDHGNVTSCYATGTVQGTGSFTGGLLGTSMGGTVHKCYSSATVTGSDVDTGGLVGQLDWHGIIYDSMAAGDVTGADNVGGLVGRTDSGTITRCYATGSANGDEHVAGLVGRNEDKIFKCYAQGPVTGNDAVGGLVGTNEGLIRTSYASGSVSGTTNVGGLVGAGKGAFNSFWDTETSGQTTSAAGTGKTTAQMYTAATFMGWACGSVWTIDEGNDYPRLAWENRPGLPIDDQLSDFLPGAGTQADPYLIHTPNQLNLIGLFPCEWDMHYKLIADIDLSACPPTAFNIIGLDDDIPFTGVFDGNNHTISNFTYTSPDRDYAGLFACVRGPNSTVKNLGLIDPNVNAGAGSQVGTIAGQLDGGTVSNCFVTGANVTAYQIVGALIGSSSGTITQCYASGAASANYHIGGLAGGNYGQIINSYSTASVSGSAYLGGLAAYNGGSISYSYAAGPVALTIWAGGITCPCSSGPVTSTFWDTQTTGQPTSGGGLPKTTAEMQTKTTFTDAGWDFVNVWDICEGTNYPRLIWQIPPADFLCPDGVVANDYAFFASHWAQDNCSASNDCDGTDLDSSDVVYWGDLKIFCDYWLEATTP